MPKRTRKATAAPARNWWADTSVTAKLRALAECYGAPEPSAAADKKREPLPDGPEPPDGFNHAGQTYRKLARKPFLAILFLWSRRNKTARRDELADPVWQDHAFTPDESAVQGLRKEINGFFRRKRIPWHAIFKADYLCLREGAPRKAKTKARPKSATSKARRRSH